MINLIYFFPIALFISFIIGCFGKNSNTFLYQIRCISLSIAAYLLICLCFLIIEISYEAIPNYSLVYPFWLIFFTAILLLNTLFFGHTFGCILKGYWRIKTTKNCKTQIKTRAS